MKPLNHIKPPFFDYFCWVNQAAPPRSFQPQLQAAERALLHLTITGHGWAATSESCGEWLGRLDRIGDFRIYIYIYMLPPPLIPTLSGLHACRASIDMNMLKTFASRWWIRKDMRIRLLKQMIEANRREIYIGSPQICDGSKVKKVRTQQKVLAATRWFFWTLPRCGGWAL